jgi:hypothetical protein
MKFNARLIFSSILIILLLSISSVQARKAGVPGEKDIAKGNYTAAVQKLEGIQDKTADELYLLGRAYMGVGNKRAAHKAWTETLLIDKKNSKRKRWTFLFPPKKKLKGKQKKKLKLDFEDDYKELSGIISRSKKKEARGLDNKAARTKIEAKRKDAKEEQLKKVADAKSKTIQDKQRMADRRARSARPATTTPMRRPPVRRSGGLPWGWIIFGLIIGIIIIAVIFGKPSNRDEAYFYEVDYDDHPFDRGSFYYQGRYFANQDLYYREYGNYYTNNMYRMNYDRWGSGQDYHGGHQYDEALDEEIRHDIEEREELYVQAAEAGYEADMLRADADDLHQDAVEIRQDLSDYDEAASAFDDDDQFSDDEDYGDDDDGYADDGGFEDDGGYDDGGYDDGGFDDDV